MSDSLIVDTTSDCREYGSAKLASTPLRPSYASRLNAKPVAKVVTGVCRECRANFTARRATKEFCCTACRQAFNNRKMTRGSEMYDIAMAWRDNRSDTVAMTLLCRLLAKFKEEDDRAGRRSWDSAGSVLRNKPYLRATLLETNFAAGRTDRRQK